MANNPNHMDNLTGSNGFTTDEAPMNGKKGGIASGEAKRLKKTFAELGKAMVDSMVSTEELEKIKNEFPGLSVEEITNRAVMLRGQIVKASLGDSKAFEVVRDTIGEKPVDKKDIAHSGNIVADYSVSSATEAAAKKAKEKREVIDE